MTRPRTCPKHGEGCSDCPWWTGLINAKDES